MTSLFETFGIVIANWLLTYVLHSMILTLTVLAIIQSKLVTNLSLQNLLWKVALVGGLFTTTFQVSTSWNTVNISHWTSQFIASEVEKTAESTIVSEQLSHAIEPIEITESVYKTPFLLEEEIIDQSIATPLFYAFFTWKEWLTLSWFLLVLVLIAYQLVIHFLFFKKVGKRLQIGHQEVIHILEKLVTQTRLTRIPFITYSNTLRSPIVIRNKEICLPKQALEKLSVEQQQNLLAHELAHIVRKDYYWLVIGKIIEIVFFFQPLHRLVNRNIQSTTEQLCDQWAAKLTGNRIALAQCLVEVASWVKNRSTYPLVTGMALRKSELSNRIHKLLNQEKMKNEKWKLVEFLGAAALLILVSVFAMPKVSIAMQNLSETLDYPINFEKTTGEKIAIEETSYKKNEILYTSTTALADTTDPKKKTTKPTKPTSPEVSKDAKIKDIEKVMEEVEHQIEVEAKKIEKLHENIEMDHSKLEEIHEKMEIEMEKIHKELEITLEKEHLKMEEINEKLEKEMRLIEEKVGQEVEKELDEEELSKRMEEVSKMKEQKIRLHEEKMKELHKEIEAKTKGHHEKMELIHKELAQKMEAIHEKVRGQQEKVEREMEVMHQKLEVEHKKMEAVHKELEAKHKALEKDLINNLVSDGVIKNEADLKTLDIGKDGKIKVNGTYLKPSLEAKYRKLTEKHFGEVDVSIHLKNN